MGDGSQLKGETLHPHSKFPRRAALWSARPRGGPVETGSLDLSLPFCRQFADSVLSDVRYSDFTRSLRLLHIHIAELVSASKHLNNPKINTISSWILVQASSLMPEQTCTSQIWYVALPVSSSSALATLTPVIAHLLHTWHAGIAFSGRGYDGRLVLPKQNEPVHHISCRHISVVGGRIGFSSPSPLLIGGLQQGNPYRNTGNN